jgi:hypothetical protein
MASRIALPAAEIILLARKQGEIVDDVAVDASRSLAADT